MGKEIIEYWQHPIAPGVELSRARFEHFSFERHVHLDYHIGIVNQGAQCYRHGGQDYRLAPGMLSTLNPDETHDGSRHGDQAYIAQVMSLPYELISSVAQELGHRECFFKQPLISNIGLYRAFNGLHTILSSRQARHEALDIETRLMAFTTEVLTQNASHLGADDAQPSKGHILSLSQLDVIKQKFIAQPEHSFQLDDLAGELQLSKFQFLRQFKQAVGMTPHAYLKRIRLEQAKKAIATGEAISHIANDTGFYDQSHFNKAFKKAFLITPAQFQRRML